MNQPSTEFLRYGWWDQIPVDPATGKPTLATKTQLAQDKLKPGGKPVAGIGYGRGRHERYYELYSVADAVPKRVMSPAARAKAVANLEAIQVRRRTCWQCGEVKGSVEYLRYGQCWDCIERERRERFCEMRRDDKDECILWARQSLAKPFYVVDTETTGLPESDTAEVVEIAVVDSTTGDTVYQSLVKPEHGMDATWIHGIGDDDVANAPDAREIWQQVAPILTSGRPLYAYSCDFDETMVGRMIRAAHWSAEIPVDEPRRIDTHFRPTNSWNYVRGKDGAFLTWIEALPTETEAAAHGLLCQTSEEVVQMTIAQDRYWEERTRTNEIAKQIEEGMTWRDIMEPYSAFVGHYYRSYTWQRLNGTTFAADGDRSRHRAAGDARAALAVIWRIATATHSTDGIDGEGI